MNIIGNSGRIADVSSHKLKTKGAAISPMLEASLKGDAFAWTSVTADINADDCALLVANLSQDQKLVITSLYAWSDVATAIQVHVPAAVAWAGGTGVVGVNLNRESSKLADAVAYADEQTNTLVAGNVILTLQTNETATDQFGIMVDNLCNGGLILGYNDAVAVTIVEEGAAFNCTIAGYYTD